MVGTVGILTLWILAATPASSPASEAGRNSVVLHVTFQDDSPFREEGDEKETEKGKEKEQSQQPPKTLPHDPAYEGKTAPSPSRNGIPGLPPPADEKSEKPRDAAKYKDDVGETICSDKPAHDSCGLTCDSCGSACDAACDRCDKRCAWTDGICWEGWIDQGATINTLSPRNRINGPVTYNDRSNDYQMNQAYFRLKRDVDQQGDAWDLGGRVDLLYGTDSLYATARGLEVFDDLSPKWNAQRYGLAMPQAYMEAYAPWGNGLTMKLGHFYAPFRYESVAAPDNFFYSHSYAFQYGEPTTYTGLLGETKLGEFTFLAGMTRGWDNWGDNNNNLGFVGGVRWTSPSERTNIEFGIQAGREQPDPSTNVRTAYSLIIQQKLSECWQYVMQNDLGTEPGAGVGDATANWYGVNQYLFYTINDSWKAGLRFEWFRDEGGARVPGVGQTADYFGFSPGLNWTPNDRVVVRPELRWDWTNTADCYPFGDYTRSSQLLLDCDVIVRF